MEVSGHHLQMALQIMLVINMLVTIAFIMKSTKVQTLGVMAAVYIHALITAN